jgi:demethylmenaquinone methyltransferase/2-methoxy-6-polyprenyl-1,4-benzoquinol methylase
MKKNEVEISDILPVNRTRKEARQYYDRISRIYDYLTGAFERKFAERALDRLAVSEGESVLEIGFGSGHCLQLIAEQIGETGTAHGIDISPGMLGVSQRRLNKAGLLDRVQLYTGDAVNLPYSDCIFDAVFMSFTLELFDTGDIPLVIEEISRVLKPGGRLGVVSMSQEYGRPLILRLYEFAHTRWPKYADCRPIYAARSLRDAGYEIKIKEKAGLFGLPNEIAVAVKPANT